MGSPLMNRVNPEVTPPPPQGKAVNLKLPHHQHKMAGHGHGRVWFNRAARLRFKPLPPVKAHKARIILKGAKAHLAEILAAAPAAPRRASGQPPPRSGDAADKPR